MFKNIQVEIYQNMLACLLSNNFIVIVAATRPAATRPAAAAPSSQRIVSPGDLIYNKNEAWDYYMKYIKVCEQQLCQDSYYSVYP